MQYTAALRSQHGSRTYRRREPEHTALYAVLQNELETFLLRAQTADERIRAFVERELRAFLRCGILAYGSARVHCDACGHDRLVAFSCKGRGFCPSCGGKRMTRFAEHLIDPVLPVTPVRQWVLTVPHRLRYRMAYDHDVCRAVHRAFTRALQMSYSRRAAAVGVSRGSTGAVTCIQRFGSALNLNVHFHTQALDGVFQASRDGRLTFYPLAAPTNEQVVDVLEDLTAASSPSCAASAWPRRTSPRPIRLRMTPRSSRRCTPARSSAGRRWARGAVKHPPPWAAILAPAGKTSCFATMRSSRASISTHPSACLQALATAWSSCFGTVPDPR